MGFLESLSLMTIIWVVAIIVFILIEAATLGLTTIWFAGGALAALITACLGGSVLLQIAVFLIVTCILLVFTRKIFVEKLKMGTEKTNIDALVGKKAMVTATIKPFEPGVVTVGAQPWTAIALEDSIVIENGTEVEIVEIQGVKAVVKPIL